MLQCESANAEFSTFPISDDFSKNLHTFSVDSGPIVFLEDPSRPSFCSGDLSVKDTQVLGCSSRNLSAPVGDSLGQSECPTPVHDELSIFHLNVRGLESNFATFDI